MVRGDGVANGAEIAVSVTAAAVALSHGLSADETALLGAVFTQLGDTLTTISVVKSDEKPDPPAEEGQV